MNSADVNDEIRSLRKAPSGFSGHLVRKAPLLTPDEQTRKLFSDIKKSATALHFFNEYILIVSKQSGTQMFPFQQK